MQSYVERVHSSVPDCLYCVHSDDCRNTLSTGRPTGGIHKSRESVSRYWVESRRRRQQAFAGAALPLDGRGGGGPFPRTPPTPPPGGRGKGGPSPRTPPTPPPGGWGGGGPPPRTPPLRNPAAPPPRPPAASGKWPWRCAARSRPAVHSDDLALRCSPKLCAIPTLLHFFVFGRPRAAPLADLGGVDAGVQACP